MKPAICDPKKIQAKSFEIIEKHLKGIKLSAAEKKVAQRVIHATADLKYAKALLFHRQAVKAGIGAIKKGKNIIVDAAMVKAGINKSLLSGFGGKAICFINDKNVTRRSRELKVTRAILAMRRSLRLMDGAIVAIGNAPTALFELCRLIKEGKAKPALVIGLPVGFVGAKESKRELLNSKVTYITNLSRSGGSAACAACVNALLILAREYCYKKLCHCEPRRGEAILA